MKATKITTALLILGTLVWIGYQCFKISSSEFGFTDLKQLPIAIAFLISLFLRLISLSKNTISFLFYAASTATLILGLFTSVSIELLFKTEGVLLLWFAAFAFFTTTKWKPKLSLFIFTGTALLFTITLIFETSTTTMQFAQLGFGIATTVFALIGSFRNVN